MHYQLTQPETQRRYEAADLGELSAGLNSEKSRAALDALEAIFAEAMLPQTFPIARKAGARREMFDDDHQVLFLAAEIASERNLDRPALHSFARAALQQFNHWDRNQIAGNYGSGRWSDATLAVLFDSMFVSSSIIRHRVNRMVLIAKRERAAQEHFNHARRLLSGEVAA